MEIDIDKLKKDLSSSNNQNVRVKSAIQLLKIADNKVEDTIIKTAFEILTLYNQQLAEKTVKELASLQKDWRVLILCSAFLRYIGEQEQADALLLNAINIFKVTGQNAEQMFSFLRSDWHSSMTWNIMAWFFMGLEFLDIAEECCEKSLEIKDNISETYYFKGLIYSKKAQYLLVKMKKERVEQLKELIQKGLVTEKFINSLPVNRVVALENITVTPKSTGDLLVPPNKTSEVWEQYCENAKKFYDMAINLDPNNLRAWKSKGYLYCIVIFQGTRNSNDLLSSIECFKKCTEINPKDAEAWAILADLSMILGRKEDAIQFQKKALQLDPDILMKIEKKIKLV
jgi:tetratricopeptide (TPR) repeat protein